MAQKNLLKELLKEDQEPFQLNAYISSKRCQLKKQSLPVRTQTQLRLKGSEPISLNASNPTNFGKGACCFSFQESPDLRNSSLFDFQSPTRSPFRGSNALFLHVPARTAALLLVAAMKIQKKPKSQIKNLGFGIFGSVLERLTLRDRNRKREISETGDPSLKNQKFNCSKRGKRDEPENIVEQKSGLETDISNGRLGVVLSESSKGNSKSSSFLEGCSCSGRPEDVEESEEVDELENIGDSSFCFSPLNTFRFALHRSPSPDRRSPGFAFPALSPTRSNFEENLNHEKESTEKFHAEEGEEDKDQNSPVSILDPPFEDEEEHEEEEDDDDDDEEEDENQEEVEENDDGYHLESSYESVKGAKKLGCSKKLANLDRIKLENRLVEEVLEGDDEYTKIVKHGEECEITEDDIFLFKKALFKLEAYNKVNLKRLISHMIAEEEESKENRPNNRESVIKRVCKRLESWEKVESDTIDMMVEMDLGRDSFVFDWRTSSKELNRVAMEIEPTIFTTLVEETLDEFI
ncbi:hypothetical protein Nepgr_031999 [Nepenthes gracilis]|uniref:DUF4378 domain-containing protein n=1 Tax=Nepenthes gracilis TaxID=150966 RepID=A0AAD3TJI4_NEPGR|nr:hypothetical protein Nepgr_031999 [Nepenthes gracilis]